MNSKKVLFSIFAIINNIKCMYNYAYTYVYINNIHKYLFNIIYVYIHLDILYTKYYQMRTAISAFGLKLLQKVINEDTCGQKAYITDWLTESELY